MIAIPPATSELPFPLWSGRGLKIAVVDSGVNAEHPHIVAATRGVTLASAQAEDSWTDRLGHGTAVMAAIQEKAPAAEYYAVKLFSNSLRTTTPRLIEAIEWTISNHMDLINLSLGTPNLEYRSELQSLVDRAQAAGIVLVSARQAGTQPVLPGTLPGVIGVDVDWEVDRQNYRVGMPGEDCFFASGYPRPLPGRPLTRNLHGISFAVANLTGIIARALEASPDRSADFIRGLLINEADRLRLNQKS